MENQNIIQDYGATIDPERYIRILQEHPYIPQADQCIKNIIKNYHQLIAPSGSIMVLDLGCGPGRLTFDIAYLSVDIHVIGVDISQSFIETAEKIHRQPKKKSSGTIIFKLADFAKEGLPLNNEDGRFNVIFMQGVMHHIHGEDRKQFFKRSFDLLKKNGILIIGDEFIKDYESEEERIINAVKFYLHIIDEARKGGFYGLAIEEAKNLIDDCFSGTKFAGLATEETFEHIYHYAKMINEMFYRHGSIAGLGPDAYNQIQNMFRSIKESVESLVNNSSVENFNRGDYKTSINVFSEEASLYGFQLQKKYEIGPVQYLGGMGVLIFVKK